MIESVSDFLSVIIMAVLVLRGTYFIYEVSVKNREHTMQRIESVYYRYYENADDDDADDREDLYFEE